MTAAETELGIMLHPAGVVGEPGASFEGDDALVDDVAAEGPSESRPRGVHRPAKDSGHGVIRMTVSEFAGAS